MVTHVTIAVVRANSVVKDNHTIALVQIHPTHALVTSMVIVLHLAQVLLVVMALAMKRAATHHVKALVHLAPVHHAVLIQATNLAAMRHAKVHLHRVPVRHAALAVVMIIVVLHRVMARLVQVRRAMLRHAREHLVQVPVPVLNDALQVVRHKVVVMTAAMVINGNSRLLNRPLPHLGSGRF
jgi:hypothetical protein